MKTIICGAMFLLLSIIANAQDKYYSYLDTTARWYFKKTVLVGDDMMNQKLLDTYEKYSFKKDTIVNKNQCYRAYCSYRGYPYEISLGLFNETDSVVKYLYYSHGDTLSSAVGYNFKFVADEVLDYDGYLLSKKDDIIEAIGSTKYFKIGVPWGIYYNGEEIIVSVNLYHQAGIEFLCYERDGTIIYQNPAYASCWPEAVSARMTDKEEKLFVPNPLRQTALIATEGYAELRIFTGAGREVLRASLDGAELYTIDPMMFASGMYHIVLYRTDGSADTQTVQIVR